MTTRRRTSIFVYGTLRAGEPNHGLLGRRRPAAPRVLRGLRLYVPAHGGFPYLVASGDPRDLVVGEVYRVEARTLARLDRLEGYDPTRTYGKNHYVRAVVTGRGVQAYLLARPRADLTRLPGGDWALRPAALEFFPGPDAEAAV